MDKWRYHPGVELLARDRAGPERLGPVRGLSTIRVGWGTTHDDVDGIWTLAPHDLAIALEILGSVPQPVAAAGDVDDGGQRRARTAMLDAGRRVAFARRSPIAHPARERRVELHCERGTGCARGRLGRARLGLRPSGRRRAAGGAAARAGRAPPPRRAAAFVEHLAGGPPPRSSAAEGLAVVEAIAGLRALAGLP